MIGSTGNDILVGDANARSLRGGTGRNLIIAGTAADLITGGSGDNILIAGSTNYDKNAAAPDAIMAAREPHRPDLRGRAREPDLQAPASPTR